MGELNVKHGVPGQRTTYSGSVTSHHEPASNYTWNGFAQVSVREVELLTNWRLSVPLVHAQWFSLLHGIASGEQQSKQLTTLSPCHQREYVVCICYFEAEDIFFATPDCCPELFRSKQNWIRASGKG